MIKKTIYVFGWSLGLLFATFPNIFQGKMNFQMSELLIKDIYKPYLFPLIMALALFVSDVCYVFEQEKSTKCNRPTYITEVLVLICVFLLGLTYSISGSNNSYIGFIVAWIALTIMKFLKTTKCVRNDKPAATGCVVITED